MAVFEGISGTVTLIGLFIGIAILYYTIKRIYKNREEIKILKDRLDNFENLKNREEDKKTRLFIEYMEQKNKKEVKP